MHDPSRDGQPDNDGDDFRSSLDEMLDRVVAAARAEQAPSGYVVQRPSSATPASNDDARAPDHDDGSAEITPPDIGPFVLSQVRPLDETPPTSATAAAFDATAEPDAAADAPTRLGTLAQPGESPFGAEIVADQAPVDVPSSQRQHRVRLAAAAGSLVAAVVVLAWVSPFDRSPTPTATLSLADLPSPAAGPIPAARPSSAPPDATTAPLAAPVAPVTVAFDHDSSSESAMLGELDRVAGPGDVALSAADPTAASRFTVMRYDTLSSEPAGSRIVAPLNAEEVYALVRADSPLRWLHELRQRRIDVGPAGSARARSGDALYRSLFGSPLPARNAVALPRDAALQQLLAGGDIDALLLFDGQPSRWLASLPAATRRQLRLLSLAPGNAASRRALQLYLPASVDALAADDAHAPVATLGVLTFLVAAPDTRDAGLVARSLCDGLPALRRHGHPKWREVQLSLRLPAGLPEAPDAAAALDACTAPFAPSPQPATSGARS